MLRLADALIVSESRHKTLSALYREIVDAPDATNAADCLRIAPWAADDLQQPLGDFVVKEIVAYARAHPDEPVYISIDDSLAPKDPDTRHLEPVAFHHDHTQSTPKKPVYTNGTVYIEVRLQCGTLSYAYAHRLYLREKTVRRLNRERRDTEQPRLHFRSKYRLTREMLVALRAQLPAEVKIDHITTIHFVTMGKNTVNFLI